MARPKWQRPVKNPFYGNAPGRIKTMWVMDIKTALNEHGVALDLDIEDDHLERYLTPDAAIDLGLALIDIGRKVKNLQMRRMR